MRFTDIMFSILLQYKNTYVTASNLNEKRDFISKYIYTSFFVSVLELIVCVYYKTVCENPFVW